jgi:hypothetical protein
MADKSWWTSGIVLPVVVGNLVWFLIIVILATTLNLISGQPLIPQRSAPAPKSAEVAQAFENYQDY